MGHTGPDSHIPLNPFGEKRALVLESVNPCLNIAQWTFQCPAQKAGLLSHARCQQGINT